VALVAVLLVRVEQGVQELLIKALPVEIPLAMSEALRAVEAHLRLELLLHQQKAAVMAVMVLHLPLLDQA
jgi:hypothetical protein